MQITVIVHFHTSCKYLINKIMILHTILVTNIWCSRAKGGLGISWRRPNPLILLRIDWKMRWPWLSEKRKRRVHCRKAVITRPPDKKKAITWMLFVRPVVQHFPIKSYSSGAHRSPNRLISNDKNHPVQFRQSWTIIASKRTRGASSKSSTRHRYFSSEAAVGGGAMDLAKMRPIKRSSEYTEFLDSSAPHQYNILRRWVEVMSQIQKIFAP